MKKKFLQVTVVKLPSDFTEIVRISYECEIEN